MQQENKQLRYYCYIRRSLEAEDRQVQSLDDQWAKLNELTQRLDLKIVKVFRESKSARHPGKRPIFEDMMHRLEAGEADGILCWEINRLTRNPIDSGRISWLLEQEKIKSIRTYTREYKPEDNVLIFKVESGMGEQFIKELKRNTKRGLDSKASKGWLPNRPVVGYLNNDDPPIIKDPERFHLIRKAWDLMLTGNSNPRKIAEIANNEWGFRTKKRKKSGGTKLSISGIYRAFTNIFYAGIVKYKGVEYQGKHEPMVTLDEYNAVQQILGRKGRPRPKKHEFAYTGIPIRCGECGCHVTAEEKTKFIKSTGKLKLFTYYHCTKRKKDCKCKQPSVLLEDLEHQIDSEVLKFTIYPEFRDWAISKIKRANETEIRTRTEEYEMVKRTYENTMKQIDNLVKMRYNDLINDEQFKSEKQALQNQATQLKVKLDQVHNRVFDWIDLTERAFYFATDAKKRFENGSLADKKEILSVLGQNFILKDKKLHLKPVSWLKPVYDSWSSIKSEYDRLEPPETRMNKETDEVLASVLPIWGS